MLNNCPKAKIRLTNLGKWLVFLCIFLLFSAQNTGNNLLYLVCSCIFTAILLAFVDIFVSTRKFKAELSFPKVAGIGQNIDIICRIAKNNLLTRYFVRFEDEWLETIEKGQEGFIRKKVLLENKGKYLFKNFSIIKPSMLDIFYFQYVFPDISIYALDDEEELYSGFIKNTEGKERIKKYGRDGDFYAHEPYNEGKDASHINWTVSARTQEEWVVVREKDDFVEKEVYKEKSGSTSEELPLETFEINGYSYNDLSILGQNKEINSSVYRMMILLGLLGCFGIFTTSFLQKLTFFISIIFIILGIKGKAIDKKYHNIIYTISVLTGFYILFKSISPNSPLKIVLLLEFSLLILVLQFFTMVSIRNVLASLTLVLMIILGIAAMNINSAYPVIFLPFLILTSMLLSFLRINLVSTNIEAKNKFAINPKGMFGTVFLLIIFILLWIPFFYLIPRTNSYGIASNFAEQRQKGFSGATMKLDGSGFLEDNLSVVMRVIPKDEKTLAPSIIRRLTRKLIRGGSFSEYDRGEWKKNRRAAYVRDLRSTSGELNLDRDFTDFKELHNFEIVLENPEIPIVFIPDLTKKIVFESFFIGMESDRLSFFFVDRNNTNTKRYIVSMLIDRSNKDLFSLLLDDSIYEDNRLLPYLSLNGSTDKIQKLANDLMAKKESAAARIRLALDYLANNCSYSLEQPELLPGQDPIEMFLFERMPGTCQHYATALVFLLRCMGIPCRVANGFIMSEWNETGGFFTVRQSHAHAWVEVLSLESGWVTIDPTPVDDSDENNSRLKQAWDKLVEIYEGYWFNYVYSFDQKAQSFAKKNIFKNLFKDLEKKLKSVYFWVIFLILGFICAYNYRYIEVIGIYLKNYSSHWIPFSYIVWEKKLKTTRRPNETPYEFHNRLLKEKIINDESRKILMEVENLIDELAFKANVDKRKTSKEITNLLHSIRV